TLSDDLLLDALGVEALAVVGDIDGDLARLVSGGDADLSALGLALGQSLLGPLDAVVGAVADEMRQRISDNLDELAVQLGVGTLGDEIDALAEARRQLAHKARKVGIEAAHGLHARAHDRVLEVAGQRREMLKRGLDRVVLAVARELEKLIAGQDQ